MTDKYETVSDIEILRLLIKAKQNHGMHGVAWRLKRIAAMVFEMEDAQEHLESLTRRLSERSCQFKQERREQSTADLLGEAEGALRRLSPNSAVKAHVANLFPDAEEIDP